MIFPPARILYCSESAGALHASVGYEAMAAGIPCVVTEIGDSTAIVGTTGHVVPTRDPEALARAWQSLLELAPERRRALGAAARDRIGRHFSLAASLRDERINAEQPPSLEGRRHGLR